MSQAFLIPWLLLMMTMIGLLLFLLAGRRLPKKAATWGLLLVLIGYVLLIPYLFPLASFSDSAATLLFLTTLGFFKLMAFFERPHQ